MNTKLKKTKPIVTTISASLDPVKAKFGIDKIVIDIEYSLHKDQILSGKTLKLVDTKIGFDKAVKIDGWITLIYLAGTDKFRRAIIKGSTFSRYSDLKDKLTLFFPEKKWNLLTICDIEYKIDFSGSSFKDINSRIFVSGKKTFERVIDSGNETTRYFGKQPRIQTIYNKENQSALDMYKGVTRFETRLKGHVFGKHWERKLCDLKHISLDNDFNPFMHVYYLDYVISSEKCCKVKLFTILVDIVGFQRARAYFNKDRNFSREKKKLFTNYSETCIGDFYHSEMRKYFSQKEV